MLPLLGVSVVLTVETRSAQEDQEKWVSKAKEIIFHCSEECLLVLIFLKKKLLESCFQL